MYCIYITMYNVNVCLYLEGAHGGLQVTHLLLDVQEVRPQPLLLALGPLAQLRQLHQGTVEPLAQLHHQALQLRRGDSRSLMTTV